MIAVTQLQASNGGVTTHVLDLCEELLKRHHRVVLVADDEGIDYRARVEVLQAWQTFRFYPVKILGMQKDFRQVLKTSLEMRSIARRHKIKIIHTHGQALCIACQLVKMTTGIPYVWTNHIDEMAQPQLFAKILKVLHFPIISVSTDLKNYLVSEFGVNPKRITVVTNGIALEAFDPLTEDEKKTLREKFNPEGKYLVSLLARMSYGKGHKYLLEAIRRLQDEKGISDIRLLVAGKLYEPQYLDGLIKTAQKNHIDMEFLGFQSPREIFGISDVAILPSLYEGFPLTVIEALVMGCPVIRSDTPGWYDTQAYCLTFPKKDTARLTEHLLYFYEHRDEAARMGAAGQRAVREHYTIGRQVDETVAVYKRILSR